MFAEGGTGKSVDHGFVEEYAGMSQKVYAECDILTIALRYTVQSGKRFCMLAAAAASGGTLYSPKLVFFHIGCNRPLNSWAR
jgi:hypothetical protein